MTDLVAIRQELDNDPLGWGYNGTGIKNPGPGPLTDAECATVLNLIERPRIEPVTIFELRTYLSVNSYDNGQNEKFLFEFAEDLSDFGNAPLSPLAPVLTSNQIEAGKLLFGYAQFFDDASFPDFNGVYKASVDALQAADGCSVAQQTALKAFITDVTTAIEYKNYIAGNAYNNGTNQRSLAAFISDMSEGRSPLAPIPGNAQVQAGGFIENLYRGYQSEDLFNFADAVWAGAGGIVDRFQAAGGCSPAQATELKEFSNGLQSRAQELVLGETNEGTVQQARAL